MNKLKIVDKFSAIKAMLNGESVKDFSVEDAIEFLNERIAITEKKNANGNNGERKPTKEQIANEGVKTEILGYLATQTEPVSIKEICVGVGIDNPQKITALVSQMLTVRKGVAMPDGKVVRTEIKGKAFFALPKE
jgi:hypothetical protein